MNVMVKTLLVGGVCIASIACQSNQSAQTTEVVEQKPKVTTEVATLQDVEQVSTFTGNVEGFAVNNITPQQARRIS